MQHLGWRHISMLKLAVFSCFQSFQGHSPPFRGIEPGEINSKVNF